MDEKRKKILARVDERSEQLKEVALKIWENPELGNQEFKAMGWLTDFAERDGFCVSRGAGGMPTAFLARRRGREDGPHVAFLAEYDALPGIGHGCGHNLIAAASLGAAVGLASVLDELEGTAFFIGTPAEESLGGKILLLERGCFEEVDFALMMHPSTKSIINRPGLACCLLRLVCRGKSAHSAGPWRGVNALQAVLEFFRMIDGLRATFEPDVRVSGIVTEGGSASNVIPELAKAEFTVRARTAEALKRVLSRLEDCAKAASLVTGAEVETDVSSIMEERYPNQVMEERFKKYCAVLGEPVGYPAPDEIIGSSDIGNVSRRLPATHSYLKIGDEGVNAHSVDFARCARSEEGMRAMLTAAKSMALTAFDLLSDPSYAEEAYREFSERVPGRSGALEAYRLRLSQRHGR